MSQAQIMIRYPPVMERGNGKCLFFFTVEVHSMYSILKMDVSAAIYIFTPVFHSLAANHL